MKRALIACSFAAFATAVVGLQLNKPGSAQQRYFQAHNQVERIAFRSGGTEELRQAVTSERMAEKELYVIRDLAGKAFGVSAACSAAALILGVISFTRKTRP